MNYTNKNTSLCEDTADSWKRTLDAQTFLVKWAVIGLTLLLTLAAVILNIVLIVKISERKRHKLFTRCFLISNAVADFSVGITIMPFSIYGMLYDNRTVFGNYTCNAANSCDVMFTSASMMHFTVLAFERFVVIKFPFSYEKICGWKTMIVLLIICWIVPATMSFGLIMPNLNIRGIEMFAKCVLEQSKMCVLVMNNFYAIVPEIISFWIPATCVIVLNILVCRTLQQQQLFRDKILNQSRKSQSRIRLRHESRATLTVSMMTCLFLIVWAPFFIFVFVRLLVDYKLSEVAMVIVLWMGYANAAANPTLFFFLELRK